MAHRKKDFSEFGEYLDSLISEAGMFKSDFYENVGINRPYFYQILRSGSPSQETLESMISELSKTQNFDDNKKRTLYDLAAKSRNEIPVDIAELIKSHPDDWDKIRTLLVKNLPRKRKES